MDSPVDFACMLRIHLYFVVAFDSVTGGVLCRDLLVVSI
jgi:hypothetical protein